MHAYPLLTFNPGPSQISEATKKDMIDIAKSNFLSVSHRSKAFSQMSEEAIEGMRRVLKLPREFHIFYRPSATASWETILRNCVVSESVHFVNGAFSERFFNTAVELGLKAYKIENPWERGINLEEISIPNSAELITLAHCETSTGAIWPNETMRKLREQHPNQLIAIDITSSAFALNMDWSLGDIWYGSIQKCLGLPSGMGFLVVHEKAFQRSLEVTNPRADWNHFAHMQKMMEKYQTVETPNMFAIALLAQKMKNWDLDVIEKTLLERAPILYRLKTPYIEDPNWRSPTVANFRVENPEKYHQKAQSAGFVLGEGYGPLKKSCYRIANFPAIDRSYLEKVVDVLNF